MRCFIKKIVFERWNSATCYVKFYDHKQLFLRLVLPPKYTKSHLWQAKIISKIYRGPCPSRTLLGWLAPSDLTLIYIPYYASWRLHCTLRIPVSLWDWNSTLIYIERWICVQRNGGGEIRITKFIKIYEGDYFNNKTFKGGSAKCYCNKWTEKVVGSCVTLGSERLSWYLK